MTCSGMIERLYLLRDWLVALLFLPYDFALDCYQASGASALLSPKTNHFLKGNYAPVPPTEAEDLVVIGELPKELSGAFLRNGPNPEHIPAGGYHWFDGDGMIHCVRIRGGKASYAARYVDTPRLAFERKAGRASFARIGTSTGPAAAFRYMGDVVKSMLLWRHDIRQLFNHSNNTNIVWWGGRLLALVENSMPGWVALPTARRPTRGASPTAPTCDEAAIRSVVPWFNWGGELKRGPFTAHPKTCPETGEMFSFGYTFMRPPFMRIHCFNAPTRGVGAAGCGGSGTGAGQAGGTAKAGASEGTGAAGVPSWDGAVVRASYTVPGSHPSMNHDMSLTRRSIIVQDQPLRFSITRKPVVRNGIPFHFEEDKPMRFGVVGRECDSADTLVWVDGPKGFSFHTGPAWDVSSDNAAEVGGKGGVALTLCVMRNFCLNTIVTEMTSSPRNVPYLYKLHLDTTAGGKGMRSCVRACSHPGEFPTYNTTVSGKVRYVYLATPAGQQWPSLGGVAKVDLDAPQKGGGGSKGKGEEAKQAYDESQEESSAPDPVGVIEHGDSCSGGECVFVPRAGAVEEDDGWLMTFVWNSRRKMSEFVVYDAKTFSSTPVARVVLPQRVPFGFHGTWAEEAQLDAQIASVGA